MQMYQLLNGEVREITIPDAAEEQYRDRGWRKTPPQPEPEVSDAESVDEPDHDNEGDSNDS